MAGKPTIDDVARIAQVSRQTVSNVVNSPEIVRPETRARVEDAIGQLGYRPHASARRLRSQKSSTIGIRLAAMGDGISGSVLDRFLHALTEGAYARGMRVLLFTADDDAGEIEQIERLRDDRDADAFVLTSTSHSDLRTRWLLDQGIPFVTFGRPWAADDMGDPMHHWVDVDGRAGLRAAAEHLIATGARRVAYLGWPSPSATGDDRRRGWADAMSSRGASESELASLSIEAEEDVTAARVAVAEFLDRRPDVDAIATASDSLALGALIATTALGRTDVAITGFDNTPVAAAVGLTSVEQRLGMVADGVLELLMGVSGRDISMREPRPGEAHRLVTPELVVRGSGGGERPVPVVDPM
ncbi:LacI family DNA-binding transcriptional regulator [Amnibacterium flavum]|uniref:LacI family transcriptional regulator n=1 Tax=Amnibacterium flavum TaxID=2173173 RepID=A0A2V1HSH7_9MICO|nr:LacI family DNA-binding transcriptional regulator [Amnibacterium flavum]PVZ95291.1 LacI family transcriptional regulator [Amnibacterium flavum]